MELVDPLASPVAFPSPTGGSHRQGAFQMRFSPASRSPCLVPPYQLPPTHELDTWECHGPCVTDHVCRVLEPARCITHAAYPNLILLSNVGCISQIEDSAANPTAELQ